MAKKRSKSRPLVQASSKGFGLSVREKIPVRPYLATAVLLRDGEEIEWKTARIWSPNPTQETPMSDRERAMACGVIWCSEGTEVMRWTAGSLGCKVEQIKPLGTGIQHAKPDRVLIVSERSSWSTWVSPTPFEVDGKPSVVASDFARLKRGLPPETMSIAKMREAIERSRG